MSLFCLGAGKSTFDYDSSLRRLAIARAHEIRSVASSCLHEQESDLERVEWRPTAALMEWRNNSSEKTAQSRSREVPIANPQLSLSISVDYMSARWFCHFVFVKEGTRGTQLNSFTPSDPDYHQMLPRTRPDNKKR